MLSLVEQVWQGIPGVREWDIAAGI